MMVKCHPGLEYWFFPDAHFFLHFIYTGKAVLVKMPIPSNRSLSFISSTGKSLPEKLRFRQHLSLHWLKYLVP